MNYSEFAKKSDDYSDNNVQIIERRFNRNLSGERGHVRKECQSNKIVNVCQQQVTERLRISANSRENTGSVTSRKTLKHKEPLRIDANCGKENTRFKCDEKKCYNLRNWMLKE